MLPMIEKYIGIVLHDRPRAETILVTISEACEIAKVSRRTIYNWMDAGKLRVVRTTSGLTRIVLADLFPEGTTAVQGDD